MRAITEISRVCERRATLVSRVYGNVLLCLGLFALTSFLFISFVPFSIARLICFLSVFGSLGTSIYLQSSISFINSSRAFYLLITYSILNGIAFSPLIYLVGSSKVAIAGLITASLLLLSVWVSRTFEIDQTDSNFISISCLTLLGMSIINMFLGLSLLEFLICVVGAVTSFGLSAYEIYQLENSNFRGDLDRVSTLISLRVFISIISMFGYILRLLYLTSRNRD